MGLFILRMLGFGVIAIVIMVISTALLGSLFGLWGYILAALLLFVVDFLYITHVFELRK